jgi:hypothetical protein
MPSASSFLRRQESIVFKAMRLNMVRTALRSDKAPHIVSSFGAWQCPQRTCIHNGLNALISRFHLTYVGIK